MRGDSTSTAAPTTADEDGWDTNADTADADAETDTAADTANAGAGPARDARHQRSRTHRVLVGALVLLLLPAVAVVALAHQFSGAAAESIRRTAAAEVSAPAAPPAAPVVAPAPPVRGLNILVVGNDARVAEPGTPAFDAAQRAGVQTGLGRTDAMMLVHLSEDRTRAHVISLPRDAWVRTPGTTRRGKISWAYEQGGSTQVVETVRELTGIRVDHTVVVDFAGFVELVDMFGGVYLSSLAGTQWLHGVEALQYFRESSSLPRGDQARIERQQAFLRAFTERVRETELLEDPDRLRRVLEATAGAFRFHPALDGAAVHELLWSLRRLRPEDVTFLSVPVEKPSEVGGRDVLLLDEQAGATLWRAVREDRVEEWLTSHDASVLGPRSPDVVDR